MSINTHNANKTLQVIKHGGNLREAAQHYHIPLADWIDLSTGINPNGWQPTNIPQSVWQRLPEDNDGLLSAAQAYYNVDNLLAVAGSQAAIQTLPYCRSHSQVGIVSPAYAEYDYCWRKAGHEVIAMTVDEVEQHLNSLDVLIVINPNNPDAHLHSLQTLQQWHDQLAQRGAWLIVDEAFMDSTPEHSLFTLNLAKLPNVLVLRSLGKFFGLAGLRLGFIAASPTILQKLQVLQGTWPISHPARWVGKKALLDTQWQCKTRQQLKQHSQQLAQCFYQAGYVVNSTALFCYLPNKQAKVLQQVFAQQGIWLRYFTQPQAIRIGLPNNSKQIERLGQLLI